VGFAHLRPPVASNVDRPLRREPTDRYGSRLCETRIPKFFAREKSRIGVYAGLRGRGKELSNVKSPCDAHRFEFSHSLGRLLPVKPRRFTAHESSNAQFASPDARHSAAVGISTIADEHRRVRADLSLNEKSLQINSSSGNGQVRPFSIKTASTGSSPKRKRRRRTVFHLDLL
jgi:hypothetical protein